jgi:ribosome-associated protein
MKAGPGLRPGCSWAGALSEEQTVPTEVVACVRAARAKKAVNVKVLDLREVASFTDYFVILTGTSARQVQAIADAVLERQKRDGGALAHVEGYGRGEWVLLDYGDFVVHVFSPAKREFYDLERLWSDATEVEIPEAAA